MFNKNVKKAIAICLAIVAMGGVLAGCTTGDKKIEDGKVRITVSNWPNKDDNPAGYEIYQNRVEEFQKLYPDIEIVGDEWAFAVDTFYPKAEAGTVSTLYTVPFTEANKIIEGGYAADVSKQYKEYGYYDKTTDFVLENISRDDGIYFIPGSMYTLGVVVNLDLMKQAGLADAEGNFKAPETFDELAKMAASISEKTGKAGFIFPTTNNGGGWNFTVLAWNFGTTFMAKEDGKWVAKFNSSECEEALQWLKDLKWKHNAMPALTLVDNIETMKQVGLGEAAMALAHPAQVRGLPGGYQKDMDFIGYIKMPAGPKDRTTLMGGTYYVIREDATDAEIDAAFKWLKFIGVTPDLDENGKKALEEDAIDSVERNSIVGILDVNIWNDKSENQQYVEEIAEKYRNISPQNVASYNDKTGISYRVEEERCAQDLYKILDGCIQEVLTNKDADCKALLEEAAKNFQNNNLDYEE